MKLKDVVHFLLVTTLIYSFGLWLYLAVCIVSGINPEKHIIFAIYSLLIISSGASFVVFNTLFKNVKKEVDFKGREAFVNSLNKELRVLGFEPVRENKNSIKYKSYLWFSLRDNKVKVALRDKNKAVLKGRKQDIDEIERKLSL
jgi:hypothetical protein